MPKTIPRRGETSLPKDTLKEIGSVLTTIPDDFNAHKTIRRLFNNRKKMIDTGEGIDWAMGEALAFGSLVKEGHCVRLSGQDVERGTFSQRHSVIYDQTDESRYIPLNQISTDQEEYDVINSMLSEEAVLGYEYGYSLARPNTLTLWEAQFGDFANGAQVVFDQFISSGERKWLRMSGLVSLLPHGYEGQGPEHSSARAGTLSAALRRRQYAGCLLHHAFELFSYFAATVASGFPKASYSDDAEITTSAQIGRLEPR